jgi:hypothetical protein
MKLQVPLRVSIGIWLSLICLATGFMVWRWWASTHRREAIIEPWPNSLLSAPVTVASVAALPANSDLPSGGLRVCFSVDSFEGIPAGDRSYYETHERARQAGKGPLCLNVQPPISAVPRPGDRLTLTFMRGEGGSIVPCKLTFDGQTLKP